MIGYRLDIPKNPSHHSSRISGFQL